MTSLITLLISLLGYGSPADYSNYTEDQLNTEIAAAQAENASDDDGGGWEEWNEPGVTQEP